MDHALFLFINGFAGRSRALDACGMFLASYLPYLVGAVVLAFCFVHRKRKEALTALVSGMLAWVLARGIGMLVLRLRPYVVITTAKKLASGIDAVRDTLSFPSEHTTLFFAMATAVYAFDKKWGRVFLGAASAIGIARVFIGLHWPSDILAGAVLGAGTAWIVARAARHLSPTTRK